MKTLHLISLVFLVFTCACKDIKDSKSKPESDQNKTSETNKTSTTKAVTKDNTETVQKLVKTTPLSEEAIQQWFPETLINLNQTSSQKGTLQGLAAHGASAFYDGSNNKKFSVSITDIAGEDAEKIYKRYARYKSPKSEHEDSTSITTYFNKDGRSGKSIFVKSLDMYTIDFLYKDRLTVTVNAQNIEQEHVNKIIEAIPFERLLK